MVVEIDPKVVSELFHGHRFKVGDWVICGKDIGQIKRLDDNGVDEFSNGWTDRSGTGLSKKFRALTLENKRVVESISARYDLLREIDGEAGFNYPDISEYFDQLVLTCIDYVNLTEAILKATAFVEAAKKYTPVIDGVRLFRPKLGR